MKTKNNPPITCSKLPVFFRFQMPKPSGVWRPWPCWWSQPHACHPPRGERLAWGILRSLFLLLLTAAPLCILAPGSSASLQKVDKIRERKKQIFLARALIKMFWSWRILKAMTQIWCCEFIERFEWPLLSVSLESRNRASVYTLSFLMNGTQRTWKIRRKAVDAKMLHSFVCCLMHGAGLAT